MKILTCPLNGPRNIAEFTYGGEIRQMPHGATDEAWADYVWGRENKAGVIREWWLHHPSGTWFIAERDTTNDTVLRTYPSAALFPAKSGP
jgi:sarcosine oxidase, subunit delta